ncbi:hypothetical protein D1872_250600 [compost metagenome]
MAFVAKLLQGRFDLPVLIQRSLAEPHVEADAEAAQIAFDLGEFFFQAIGPQKGGPLLRGHGQQSVPFLRDEFFGKALDVFAVVTVLRHFGVLSQLLQITGFDRLAQVYDLIPRIINIVLPGYLVARKIKHIAQRVAYGGSTGMSQMQTSRRVGAHEFDLDLLPVPFGDPAVMLALTVHLADDGIKVAFAERKVNETGPRDFGLLDARLGVIQVADDVLGNLARILLGDAG